MTSPWPISFDDVLAARERLRPYLSPSPFRRYPLLDELVGHGIHVYVKHENHLPVQTFKVRNGLSAVTALGDAERARGDTPGVGCRFRPRFPSKDSRGREDPF